MPAVLRNNAATSSSASNAGKAKLRGGGDGKSARTGRAGKVERRLRHPDDPAAELMPAAEFLGHETDFAAILEQFPDSPFDPARRRVLGRLMGMFAMDYQGARPEERRFLRRLLAARNAREGYVANRALHLCGASHVIRRTLALGVAESRFATGRTFGFLGAVQARVAATTLRLLGPDSRELIWNLLTMAGCDETGAPYGAADRVLERALILKALGARRHRLGPWSLDGLVALEEITRFALAIRGGSRASLASDTTLLSAHPDETAAVLASLTDDGERAGVVARGELDPVFALERQGASVRRAEEAEVEESNDEALPALDRSPLLDRPRLHWALAEARAAPNGLLGGRQCETLADYLSGRELREKRLAEKQEALRILAEQGFDVGGDAAIEAIRLDAQGIYKFDAARALGDLLSRFTGATYVRRLFSDQLTAGSDPLRQIAVALNRGLAVPMTANELKLSVIRAFAAVARKGDAADAWQIEIQDSVPGSEIIALPAKTLLAPVLPESLGRRARADSYMAPAALDLLAPPFGIPFPELGIKDRL